MSKKHNIIIAAIAAIAVGSFVGYKVATNKELRERVKRSAQDVFHTSKEKMDAMTEEVAIKTAKMTKNPKINQDWVENQWESLGL